MKRYLCFAGSTYYPAGGWDDYQGCFDTIDEAVKKGVDIEDWYHIIDIQTMEKVGEEGDKLLI